MLNICHPYHSNPASASTHVQGESERSELTPCIKYVYTYSFFTRGVHGIYTPAIKQSDWSEFTSHGRSGGMKPQQFLAAQVMWLLSNNATNLLLLKYFLHNAVVRHAVLEQYNDCRSWKFIRGYIPMYIFAAVYFLYFLQALRFHL